MKTKMHSRLVFLATVSLLLGASMRADRAWGCPRDPIAEAKVDTKDVVHDGFDPDVRSYLSMFDGKDPYDFSYDPDNGCAPGLGIEVWGWWGFYGAESPWFYYTFTEPTGVREWLTVVDDDEQAATDAPEGVPGCRIVLIEPILKIENDTGSGYLADALEYTPGAFMWVGELRDLHFEADPRADPVIEGTGVIKLEVFSGANLDYS